MEMLIAEITTLMNDVLAVGGCVGRKYDGSRLPFYVIQPIHPYED